MTSKPSEIPQNLGFIPAVNIQGILLSFQGESVETSLASHLSLTDGDLLTPTSLRT